MEARHMSFIFPPQQSGTNALVVAVLRDVDSPYGHRFGRHDASCWRTTKWGNRSRGDKSNSLSRPKFW
jgi:hypothetical protein